MRQARATADNEPAMARRAGVINDTEAARRRTIGKTNPW
jgi:hypothetical protein